MSSLLGLFDGVHAVFGYGELDGAGELGPVTSGLYDVVAGALLERGNGDGLVATGGDHDDGWSSGEAAQLVEGIEPADSGEPVVEHDGIPMLSLGGGDGVLGGREVERAVSARLQGLGGEEGVVWIVFYDGDGQGAVESVRRGIGCDSIRFAARTHGDDLPVCES